MSATNISLNEIMDRLNASIAVAVNKTEEKFSDRIAALELGQDRIANYVQSLPSLESSITAASFNVDRVRSLLLAAASGRPITDYGDRRVLSVFSDQLPLLMHQAEQIPEKETV